MNNVITKYSLFLLVLLSSAGLANATETNKAQPKINHVANSESSSAEISPGQALIGNIESERRPNRDWIWEFDTEPDDIGWALYVDNDLFALRDGDRDYTGGLSLTLSGARATKYWFSLNSALESINDFTGISTLHNQSDRQLHSIETGFTVFTPSNITEIEDQLGDRPFASLLYLSNTRESIDLENDSAWVSSFTIGVLGSKLVEELQTEIHSATGSEEPTGWDNQISDGGELTFRYSIAKQNLFHFNYQGDNHIEVSTTSQASVGYITEASFGMAVRIGEFDTPWYSFRPQFNDYSEKSSSLAGIKKGTDELYFWGGFNLHARLYNSFLQGQFKDTSAAFSSSEIRPLVADAWIGVTKQFTSGWRLSYLLRGQTSELKSELADRSTVWGGFILSKGW
ncbi:MAG: lipid A deacylase LpxR family protein [Kangiellaceae bacterium]|nr:lipid A deacylase LpxR family protein [Kangiellaceae bacterium]